MRAVALSIALAVLAWPAGAAAAVDISAPGGVVTIAGDGANDQVRIAAVDDGVGKRTFVIFTPPETATVHPPCTHEVGNGFGHRCQFVGTPTELHASLGAGNDRLEKDILVFPPPASNPDWNLTADLGEGNDELHLKKDGSESVQGGEGFDFVSYTCNAGECDGGVTLDLSAGSGTDQLSGFENLGGSGSVAFDVSGTDGTNNLSTGDGADELDGRGGSDALSSGGGADTVRAADGAQDSVNCGPGGDEAQVDTADQVSECETVEVIGGAPVISSGPSGTVGVASALFEFALVGPNPPPGRFECSLDGGDFTPCSSPVTFAGLADGDHVFRVRYHPDGGDPGIAAERPWRVDTTAPVVSLDSAPSGGGHPPDVTIAFSADEQNVAFSCSLDGGPAFDCSSPQDLRALAVGIHSFAVEATDAAGNVSDQVRAEWEVVAPLPPPADFDCPPGAQRQVAFGAIVAVARAADGCFVSEPVEGTRALVANGPVSVNGIRLQPAAGTRIVVDPALVGGTVRAIGAVTLMPADVPLGWTLDEGFTFDGLAAGGAAVVNRTLSLGEGALSLAELTVSPGLQFEFSADNGGQAKVTPRVTLPRATFQSLPGLSPEGRGLTVEVPITTSNDRGLTGGIRLKLAEANLFGRIKVKDLDLFYDHTTRVFEGSAGLKLAQSAPAGRAEPTFTVALALGADGLIGPLRKLSFQVSSLNRHVGYGVFVQRFGAGLERASDPDGNALARFTTGSAGISLGPRVALGSFEVEALSLDGTVTVDVPTGSQPPELFSVGASGVAKVVDVPFESGSVRYVPPARVEVAATLDYTLFGYGLNGQLASDSQGRPLSWVSPDGFNLEARAQASFPGLGGTDPADAVFSTNGWAACIGPPGDKVGFGRRWGGSVNAMSDSCDVGPYRGGAAPAQAGGARSVRIPARARLAVLSARGDGAPPKVTVTGPGGERIETPDGPGGARTAGSLLFQDPETDTTHVMLRRPAAGRWTVAARPGSAAFTGLDVADGLPPVRVRARVSGKGRRRTLSWSTGPLPFGQRLTFVERGAQSANVLASSKSRRGRISFTPDAAPGRARTIQLIVSRNGIPRLARTVARFKAPPQPRLRRVTRVRRRAGVLTWRRQAAAGSYALAIRSRDGAVTSHSSSRARLRLPRPLRRGRLRVTIVALDPQGRVGPQTSVRVR